MLSRTLFLLVSSLAFLAASQRSLARKIAQLESLNQDSSDN